MSMRVLVGIALMLAMGCGDGGAGSGDPGRDELFRVASEEDLDSTCVDWCTRLNCRAEWFTTAEECTLSCKRSYSRACGQARLRDLECFMRQGCDPDNYGPCTRIDELGGINAHIETSECLDELDAWCAGCPAGDYCPAFGSCEAPFGNEAIEECVITCPTPEDINACVYEGTACQRPARP